MPIPFPPHVAKDVKQSRGLYEIVKEQGIDGAAGIVQGEHALNQIEHDQDWAAAERGPYGPGSFPLPYLPETESEPAGSAS